MKVTLLAHTKIDNWEASQLFYQTGWEPNDQVDCDADSLAEFAGRACYQSWSRPNRETTTNAGYLRHILRQQHESVLEHSSATFYIEGVSRSLTHELIRHRHLSYSQLSQRYVSEDDFNVVYPPAAEYEEAMNIAAARDDARIAYTNIVELLTAKGLPRKQAREAARAVLPNATETKIVVTGNMRAWRDVIIKRGSIHADAEIRALAIELLKQLKEIAPNTFQDMTITTEDGIQVVTKEEL